MVQIELIETLWNVNETENKNHNERNEGINRNIVECKYDFVQNTFYLGEPELIETLWNVNRFSIISIRSPEYLINRNIVECK